MYHCIESAGAGIAPAKYHLCVFNGLKISPVVDILNINNLLKSLF